MSIEDMVARHNAYNQISQELVDGKCDPLFVRMIVKYISFMHGRVINIRDIIRRFYYDELVGFIRELFYCAEDCMENEIGYKDSQKIVEYVKMHMKT